MNLVLLLGSAHGGSTITNMMLGQHPDVFSAGTLRGFPDNGQIVPDNDCACGVSSAECDFWRHVCDDLKSLPKQELCDERLLQSILTHSGKRFVVDVSHGLTRLGELASQKSINLHVVYVRRPLRAVVFSQVRKSRERDEYKRPIIDYVHHVLRVARSWYSMQQVSRTFCLERGIPFATISYDLMCRDPESALAEAGQMLGLDYTDTAKRITSGAPLIVPSHLIRGNKKLRAQSQIYLRQDISYAAKPAFTQRVLAQISVVVTKAELFLFKKKRVKQIEKIE